MRLCRLCVWFPHTSRKCAVISRLYNAGLAPGTMHMSQISAASLAVVVAWMLLARAVAVTYTIRGFAMRGPEPGAGMAPAAQAA